MDHTLFVFAAFVFIFNSIKILFMILVTNNAMLMIVTRAIVVVVAAVIKVEFLLDTFQ